jgi:hypothetical protein
MFLKKFKFFFFKKCQFFFATKKNVPIFLLLLKTMPLAIPTTMPNFIALAQSP